MFFSKKKPKKKSKKSSSNGNENSSCKEKQDLNSKFDRAFEQFEQISDETTVILHLPKGIKGSDNGRG